MSSVDIDSIVDSIVTALYEGKVSPDRCTRILTAIARALSRNNATRPNDTASTDVTGTMAMASTDATQGNDTTESAGATYTVATNNVSDQIGDSHRWQPTL